MDRNNIVSASFKACITSLSARRAWIEIVYCSTLGGSFCVALRKESVDRNNAVQVIVVVMHGRSPQGERG